MLIVLALLALMGTIPTVIIATTVNQMPLTTQNLDWNAAYEAAQAGLNDYLQQIDASASYTQWVTGADLCTGTSPVPTSAGGPGNDAFCTWASSPSSTAPLSTNPDEWFEYAVTESNGQVLLTVSGKAGSGPGAVVRTFRYAVAPAGATIDNIYWTNHETVQGCSGGGTSCGIYFGSNDLLNGPVFSNDYFNMSGTPTFDGTVTSSVPSPYWRCNVNGQWAYGSSGCSPSAAQPNFNDGQPVHGANENLIANGTSPDLAPSQALGCYIAGPGDSATGVQMTISGSTLTWTDASGAANQPATVQNDSTNPNTASGACGTSGATTNTVDLAKLRSPLIFVNGDITLAGNNTVSGFATLVSTGSITIGGSITYPCHHITWQQGGACPAMPTSQGTDTADALGLIAQDNILVQDNRSSVEIDAAMLAVSGSFANQSPTTNCSGGGMGGGNGGCPVLAVFGSIAQNYRGVVGYLNGSGKTIEGFDKDYVYDQSLATLWPPFFIPPAGATWVARTYAELPAGAANQAVPST